MIFLCGERVLDVDETDDVVDVIAVNGIARMALVERRGDEVVERAVDGHGVDFAARNHDFTGIERRKLEDVFEEGSGFLGDGAIVGAVLGDIPEFLGRDAGAVPRLRRLNAENLEQQVARDDEKVHDGTEHRVEDPHWHRHEHADFERFCDREAFGGELAANDVRKRDEEEGNGHADPAGEIGRNANHAQQLRQVAPDGGLGKPADAEACDGDTKLNCGEIGVQMMDNLDDAAGRTTALVLEDFEL